MTRKQRGEQLAKTAQEIQRIDTQTFYVQSQTGKGGYTVNNSYGAWSCTCPDFVYRGIKCKHIHAVEFAIEEEPPRPKACRCMLNLWGAPQ
jgi:predicted nucleic acid-binding Zn finger protein